MRELFFSLRIRFILVFIMSVAIGICVYFLVHYFSYEYIDSVYSSEENRKNRETSYINDLQAFVDNNSISSENTSMLSRWARENKYVYLIIYKDNELFYTSDDNPENEEAAVPENPEGESPENRPDDSTDKEDGGSVGDGEDGEESTPPPKEPGGVTVDYPTREELFEYAKQNDLYTLELADGTMFASLTEFTEYLYYDISNIASLVFALLSVLIILAFYFHMLTTRIIKLGNEVNKVADGDTSHVIKAKGNDEISKLSVNVENMRVSIIENFEKEKEALDANNALITSMSHDIRTPLTILLGYIDAMRNKTEGDSEMQDYLKAAESTAMRLKKLSDDMFGYFLVFGAKELEVDMENYDAATLIDQILFEHVTLMRESGYVVNFGELDYLALSDFEIRTDVQKLIRIIDNVFSNAYKYADKEAPVFISIEETDSLLTVRFSNTISKDSGNVESNGIGLKTCKKLSEYINADFKTEECDGIFTVSLSLDFIKKQGK